MNNPRFWGAVFTVLALASTGAQAVPILEIDSGGNVTGVTGLTVGMDTYNATFNDGSFEQVIFNDPTAVYSEAFANDASSALVTFMSTQITAFEPADIFGCVSSTTCLLMTVYGYDSSLPPSFNGVYARINSDSVAGPITLGGSAGINYEDISFVTWQIAGSVPEPPISLLVASGLIGFGVTSRKRRA